MGADTTSTQLIFFIAAIVVATAATGVFGTTIARLSHEVQERGDHLQDTIASDVEIINDPTEVPTGPTRLYVKNTGTSTLDKDLTTLLIDGAYTEYTATLLAGATSWKPGDVVDYSVTSAQWNPTAGDHVVRVIASNGVWDDLRITI